jgi:hypothetical protein
MLEILFFLLLFVVLIFWMWVTITTAVVAVAKGRNPVGWTLIGLLLGPIALYILSHLSQGTSSWGDLTPSSELAPGSDWPCPVCGVANPALERSCFSCGAPMPRESVQPPKLGGEADAEDSERS